MNRVYLYPQEYISYGIDGAAGVITRPDGRKEYRVTDHLGSARLLMSDGGLVIGEYSYEPFGAPLAVTGVEARKSFIDRELDSEISAYNTGVRQYDAATGRFLSTDVAWESYRGLSPFSYAAANPLRLSDPSGATVAFANEESETIFNNLYEASDAATRARYDALRNSDMTYSVNIGGRPQDDRANGITSFNFAANQVEVNIRSGLANPVGTLGDELQTCYQFETGALGFVPGGRTLGYDMEDEIETKNAGIAATHAYNAAYGTTYRLEPQIERFIEAQAAGPAALQDYFNATPYEFYQRGKTLGNRVSATLGVNGAPGATISQLNQAVLGGFPGYAVRIFNATTGSYQTHRNP